MDKLPTSKLARFCPRIDPQEREDPENHLTEVVRSDLGSEDVFHILLDSDKHQAPTKGMVGPHDISSSVSWAVYGDPAQGMNMVPSGPALPWKPSKFSKIRHEENQADFFLATGEW